MTARRRVARERPRTRTVCEPRDPDVRSGIGGSAPPRMRPVPDDVDAGAHITGAQGGCRRDLGTDRRSHRRHEAPTAFVDDGTPGVDVEPVAVVRHARGRVRGDRQRCGRVGSRAESFVAAVRDVGAAGARGRRRAGVPDRDRPRRPTRPGHAARVGPASVPAGDAVVQRGTRGGGASRVSSSPSASATWPSGCCRASR